MTAEQRNAVVQAGFKICAWPRAFRHDAQAALDLVFDEQTLTAAYRDCIQSNDANIKVTKIVKPTFRIAMLPGKVIWTLDNASVSVQQRKLEDCVEENHEKQCSGSFEITIEVIRPGSSFDPIYSANLNLVDLVFLVSSHRNNGIYNSTGGLPSSSFRFPFSPTKTQSLLQLDFRKRRVDPFNVDFQGPKSKRSRHDVPIVYSGMNESIKSTDNDSSVILSGVNQSIVSSGRDAVIVSSGVDSAIVSSGISVSITCSGTNGSVNSSGSDALIKSSGTNITIHSSGSDAVIDSTGTNSTISSTGANSSISFSGVKTRIRSSGSAINDDLGKTLIRTLANTVTECLNRRLPDNSLPADWMFENGYLGHLMALNDSGDPVMIPAQVDVPFPEPQDSGRMVTMFVSNCVINTIGYHLHHNNSLSYNLTQADLIAQESQNNSAVSASERSRCLSDCFPELSVNYPGASVEVNLYTIKAPTAAFCGQNLKVSLLGSATFRARLPDGSVVDFLKAEVDMVTTVLLKCNLGKLKGTVTSVSPTSITVVRSTLKSVKPEVCDHVFDMVAVLFLSRKFEEIAQKGIPLLRSHDEFENVEMSTADDFLRIDADLNFRAYTF